MSARDDREAWRAAWSDALAELESDIERAEAVLAAVRGGGDTDAPLPGGGWTPPRVPGPIPADLVERASALLERQRETARRLSLAMTASRRHLAVVDRLAGPAPRPMYVDRTL